MASPDARKRRARSDSPESPVQTKEQRRNGNEDASGPVADADSRRAKNAEALLGRTGGVYIPPAKLAAMRREIKDKSSEEYQKLTWEALKKSLNGLINKVNVSNIRNIIAEIFEENLIRGRGILARAVMKAQAASPNFTHVYAALIAIINTKLPEIGELLLKRVITQFKKSYKRNDKTACVASVRFMAHLVNQMVAGDILALQLLDLLLGTPTDDSVEIAVGFVQECGKHLTEACPKPFNDVFDRFRSILHEGAIDKRVQFMIEKLFATRKSKFEEFPDRMSELDLVEETDQITHEDLGLDVESLDIEERLDYFKMDPNFVENEAAYDTIKKEILGKDEEEAVSEDEEAPEGEGDAVAAAGGTVVETAKQTILDETETDKINLRRTIYLTIMSSVDFEECAHKMLKIQFRPGQEPEFCNMTVECCAQERTYMRFYGLLAQRFCMLNPIFQEVYIKTFADQYATVHRLDTNKIRNVAKFFGHLLHTDAVPWMALECVHLNEAETTSSSRIFIKILFQELSEFLGIAKLNARLKDPTMQEAFKGIMPRDNPKNTRFSINFFTSIGLGGLTDDLREWLKNAPKAPVQEDDSSSSLSSSSSSSSSDSESSSSSGSD